MATCVRTATTCITVLHAIAAQYTAATLTVIQFQTLTVYGPMSGVESICVWRTAESEIQHQGTARARMHARHVPTECVSFTFACISMSQLGQALAIDGSRTTGLHEHYFNGQSNCSSYLRAAVCVCVYGVLNSTSHRSHGIASLRACLRIRLLQRVC